ncbi:MULTISPECIES: hypothetical protein [unclassified Pseudomonas]|uniref:hypothetical protein n=1 Tax=unclassified Pseudomonas TaxID=196821 RepID=UPI00119F29BC|nr:MULTISPECIES: hypothetical protein [unclassified Pseudomonas]
MTYVQERSFIATFTSVTPGYEGWLDSLEGSPTERRNQWLTVRADTAGFQTQQGFWFGYYQGDVEGYQVRTVAFDSSNSHYDLWGLSLRNSVGYYAKSTHPISWRVRLGGVKIVRPEVGQYDDVTLAAPARAMLSCATRPAWDDHYVGVGKKNVLQFRMDIREVGVARFDSPAMYRG